MNVEPSTIVPSDTEPPSSSAFSIEAEFERVMGCPLSDPDRAFLEQMESDMRSGDVPGLSREELTAGFAELWQRAGKTAILPAIMLRRAGTGKQSVSLLEVVDVERPFLMDSLIGELTEQDFAPLATFRAVVEADVRDLPSPIRVVQFVLPALTDRQSARLVDGIDATLVDLRSAVDDVGAMQAVLVETTARLQAAKGADPELRSEEIAFLEWLASDHFVLLGTRVYHYPRDAGGALAADEPLYAPTDGLGVLSDPDRRILRRRSEPTVLTPQLKLQAESSDGLIVAKSNFRSRVHRRVHCDYVGVTLHDADGRPEGEVRFLGLFTAEAYDRSVANVPLLRLKVRRLIKRIAQAPGRADPRRFLNILENHPRDELFQADEDELCATLLGIAELRDRPRVRLFARTDRFDRFVSALLFVPRNRYDAAFEERAGRLLAAAHGGRLSAAYPAFGDSPMARVHYIIGLTPGDHPRPDLVELERQLAETSLGWSDRFKTAAVASHGAIGDIDDLLPRWSDAFGAGYREKYDAEEALIDIVVIEESLRDAAVAVRAFRGHDDPPRCFRFKLYHREHAIPLADVLPILEDMGLKALVEDGFAIRPGDGEEGYWIHEFLIDDPRGVDLVFRNVAKPFEDAFIATWTGRTESDGFNRLVLELGVSWREAALVRALARFRQQTGLDPSQPAQERALAENQRVAKLLLDLFRTRFDPAAPLSPDDRAEEGERLRLEVEALLEDVPDLDADRVLRRLLALILAVQRTNFYQTGSDGRPKPCIALKIASRELADLPLPKPWREIFVSAPNVEGSHLRFGPVARGGLRWSDRRDDFRSEVLGLVKAQQVKNAVIVPVGSKGGFYAKSATSSPSPEDKRAAGVDAYRTFLSGMLDMTDNIGADGTVVSPPDLVAHDGDDPYLVVAADKGTASFSDIANEVSASYGFWLGDAFASGGSAGYDHKAMAITARGAWEAVKRHFRDRGKDIQAEPFTVAGVGDMSGDVFGNGMLLSKQTRLIAAFDHRDIFIDPAPDPSSSWKERKRLFSLPRSSWQDYDKAKISAGGGVFPRFAKTIPLSPQARAALGIAEENATPAELMRAILKAPVELLYMGGIGTYAKGSAETNADAADKSNDAIRVDGADLRATVVGEGANLGFTQAARIEFARAGGRINTDAIDNSGGVDSSDLEVNIKILTAALEASGALDRKRRDALLASMTDRVAGLVLGHNRAQTLALSLVEADAVADLDAHAAFIANFETQGRLDRSVEGLPSVAALAELKKAGGALTRPELAILMAYSKLALFDAIVASSAPDDPWFEATLRDYFPRPLHRFGEAIGEHRLRREIVATVLANDIVDMAGPTFPWTLMASTGRGAGALVTAFVAAREIFRVEESWTAVQALDGTVPATTQLQFHRSLSLVLRHQTSMLVRRDDANTATVAGLVEPLRPAVDQLRGSGHEPAVEADHSEQGVPGDLIASIAALNRLADASIVIDLASAAGREVAETAEFLRRLRAELGASLYAAAGMFAPADPIEREAAERIMVELTRAEEGLARELLHSSAAEDVLRDGIDRWLASHEAAQCACRRTLASIEVSEGAWTLGKLVVAQGAVLDLIRTLRPDVCRSGVTGRDERAHPGKGGSAARGAMEDACHA